MITITMEDIDYKRMMDWLRSLSYTLPIEQRLEMEALLFDLSTKLCQTATVFDGSAFETFLERLDLHPEPERMKALLDKARVRSGDQTPF